ncbi:epoxide hydrolase family protein [Microbacterium invictum]|uniref:Pimeloyl-ACP methyl ester carboxylesterase n=1 Tax=Microbacterium invictum TaxID=515415 RepID=A0AA40SMP7_9MICO|nr:MULTISPECIES: epoxide hydrolase [Microbacterium]MBB4139026.1 pimeloyl-ACP methyl ester carboxylesterase [Microbacterium invictum]
MTLQPFRIQVPDADLDDLRARLARTRFLPDSAGRPASGMSAGYLRALTQSWREFDWRAREAWLNAHPQFLADVDGVRLHITHLRSARVDAPALLVMHGWPHTFALQLEFAALLTDFHVVLPSFPGFGFSPPADATFDEAAIAALMHRLMTDTLGYERFLTYGEDISANVSDLIAAAYPGEVLGIVATHAHFPTDAERAALTAPDERAFFDRLAADGGANGGYAHEQATRPDTLAAALNDSPAGLLAWIAEKLVEWSDTPAGDPAHLERRIARERVLTEATIYWATQSIASSFRPYFDRRDAAIPPVAVPAAVAIQRHEHDYPESVARAFYRDLRSFDRLPEGGHFAAAEVPGHLAARVRAFAEEIGALPRGA